MFGSKVGQIGPQIGQIWDFFRSDFSKFCLPILSPLNHELPEQTVFVSTEDGVLQGLVDPRVSVSGQYLCEGRLDGLVPADEHIVLTVARELEHWRVVVHVVDVNCHCGQVLEKW